MNLRLKQFSLLAILPAIILLGVYFYNFIPDKNLGNFYEITKEDLLFYDPRLDSQLLQDSADALSKIDETILKYDTAYRQNEPEKYRRVFPDGWRIWPDEFLTALSSVNDSTTRFLNEPTPPNARTLLELQEQTVKNYKTAIDLHIQAMENVFKNDPTRIQQKIVFLGSATTPEIVLNDFMLIRKNAQALENEVAQRKKCLYEGKCPVKKSSGQANLTPKNSFKISYEPVEDEVLGINRDKEAVFGPYWTTTGCFGLSKNSDLYSHPFYIVEKPQKNSDKINLFPVMTNTKYYRDYRQVPNQPIAQIWLKRGVTIRPHPGLTDYLCTDLRYLAELILQYLQESQKTVSPFPTQSKLSTLPYLIQRTAMYSNFMIYDLMYTKKPYDPLYLLINRSAYSLYFGTFSPSVWRLSESPTFLIQQDFTDVAFRSGYTTYEKLTLEGMSREQIIKLNTIPHVDDVYREELLKTQSGQSPAELDF